MKNLSLFFLSVVVSSCAGMKVEKNSQPQQTSKPGITWGGSPVSGGLTVQKVGFWCEAKHGVLSFSAFGETEEKARANAQGNCRGTFKDGKCDIASCKPAQDSK